MNNATIISFNKNRLIKYFIISILFIVTGILFITNPMWFIKSNDSLVIKIIGYAVVIFFSACGIFISQKLFDKKPGLILDAEGITDNSSAVAAGKILWKDIKSIAVQQVQAQSFIMINVKNPEFYLQRERNPIKKRMMELNYRLYQTPLHITANGLKIGFEELYEIITEKYNSMKL